MDKKEAFNIFFKQNLNLFTQDPFLMKDFTKIKREFFLNIAKLRYVPKNTEIANEALDYMIKLNQISSINRLNQILDYPFFEKYVHDKEYFNKKIISISEESVPVVDPKKLEDEEYRKEVLEGLEKKAEIKILEERKDKINKLDELIKIKKEEYRVLPSILDEMEYVPLEFNDEIEDSLVKSTYMPWWERLNLEQDPFLVLEGLARLDTRLFDQIVQKTSIFQKYDSLITNAPSELFKNTVIIGQFGSGKTTFFDYFRYKLREKKVVPIYIQLGGVFELRELIYDFRRKFYSELKKRALILTGIRYDDTNYDNEDQIISMLRRMIEKEIEGFIIIIDDLHKGDISKALDFISNLQVFISELIRQTYNLNLSIFIAGIPEWEITIKDNPKYSGSIARIEYIPPLTVDDVYDAINKRLKAFSKNPENPRIIDFDFIETIYEKIEKSGGDLTFRNLIREVINRLDDGDFDILKTNPIEIPDKILSEIKRIIEKDITLSSRIHALMYSSKLSRLQAKKAIKLIVDMYLSDGIYESDIKTDVKNYLKVLVRRNLITKTYSESRLKWRICKELWNKNQEIISKYNLSLEDYLLKIYFVDYKEEDDKIKIVIKEIKDLEYLSDKIKNKVIKQLLNESLSLHKELLNMNENELLRVAPDDIITKCTTALSLLSKSCFSFVNSGIDYDENDMKILASWKRFWWSPEPVEQYQRALNLSSQEIHQILPTIFNLYREAYPQIVDFLYKEYKDSNLFRIPINCLNKEEISLLHDCRRLYKKGDYFESIKQLTNYLELKLRNYLYNVFRLLYGSYENRINRLDKNSRNHIIKNIKKDKKRGLHVSRNEFFQLNRSNYRSFMTGIHGSKEGKANWEEIFQHVFTSWEQRELDSYLSEFADINIVVSHMKKDAITPEQQSKIYSFILKSINFIKLLNNTYQTILLNECHKFKKEALFSFCNFKDEKKLYPIRVSKEDVKQFTAVLDKKNYSKITLNEYETLEALFGLNYRTIVSLISSFINQSEEEKQKTKYKMDVLTKNGCDIYLKLNKYKS